MLLCDVVMPCKLDTRKTGMNSRGYWRPKARHNKMQAWNYAAFVQSALPSSFKRTSTTKLTVTFTRIAPPRGRWQFDDDNLCGNLKHLRDAVAKVFGVDDGNTKFWTWKYEQAAGPDHAVRCRIESVTTPIASPEYGEDEHAE